MVPGVRDQRDGRRQNRTAVRAVPQGHDHILGRRSLLAVQSREEIPKIASNDRTKATAGEAQAIVASCIAYYGTYSIDEQTSVMVVNLAASTFANVAAVPDQKRTITLLTADELRFDNPRTPTGMTLRTAWKRAPAP